MKNLNTYIQEGLFDNIGVGVTETSIINWIESHSFGMSSNIKITIVNDKFIVNAKTIWLDEIESVNNNGMFEYGDEIQEFILTGNKNITSLKGCPKKCLVFRCDECPKLKTLEGAPQECMSFDAYKTNLTELKGIENLKCEVLDLSFCRSLKSLKGAPKKCRRAEFDGCSKLKDLNGCPDCKELNVSYTGIESVKGIGKHVKSLQIENCKELQTLEDLPNTCKKLSLYNCKKLDKSTIKVKNININE